MNADHVLFVGGGMDGRWLPDIGLELIRCAVPLALPLPTVDPPPLPSPDEYAVQMETYRRERIRSEREEWPIYVLNSLGAADAMGMIIRGYKPNTARRL